MNTVFFDIDTQLDFLYPAGALYVPGAERIVPAVARLNRWAAEHGNTVVSSMDAHAENDLEFRTWPPHCVAGTAGQAKPCGTLLDRRIVIPNTTDSTTGAGAPQIILEKQTTDIFQTHTIQALLEKLHADRYLVYGVVTEICVARAALGLQQTGRPVAIVTDAVESLSADAARRLFDEFTSAGGVLTSVSEVCQGR
jgi:nicotinamidase/pyrazinamidase